MPAEADAEIISRVHNPQHTVGGDSLHRVGETSVQVCRVHVSTKRVRVIGKDRLMQQHHTLKRNFLGRCPIVRMDFCLNRCNGKNG